MTRGSVVAVAALLFSGSAATTIEWSASMTGMGTMPMPGGWTLSVTWMRLPGATWAGAAAAFVAMWTVMMVAMMLPSLVPVLHLYRGAIGGGAARAVTLTALVAVAYFVVWSALGVAVFPLGAALASAELHLPALARAVPVASGVIVLIAGAMQFTAWKARHLAWDHEASERVGAMSADAGAAWRHGLCLGLHCSYCCAGLTASFLVFGVMDLRAMAVATVAITAERLAPAGARMARVVGVAGVCVGTLMIARVLGAG